MGAACKRTEHDGAFPLLLVDTAVVSTEMAAADAAEHVMLRCVWHKGSQTGVDLLRSLLQPPSATDGTAWMILSRRIQ